MTKAQSGPFDEEDIVTPSSQGQAAEKVGAGLRMPPIIDMAPSWRARLADTTKGLLRGTLYQASLIALLFMALGLMVLTLMQAGNVTPPDWRKFAPALEGLRVSNSPPAIEKAETDVEAGDHTDATVSQKQLPDRESLPLATPDRALQQAGPTSPDRPNDDIPDAQTSLDAVSPDMEAEIIALRQTLADTRRDLAAAQAALLDTQAPKGAADVSQVTKRGVLAELLLRLDDGVAFDDLLDGGQLDEVLSKSELAALALHAARGVPTEAGILAQAETLPLIISRAAAGGAVDEPLPMIFRWLADKAPNLLRIRKSPMAGAQKQLRVLYDQLQVRDYRAAAATTRLLVLTYDVAENQQNEAVLALQALYADLRAFSETSAARRDLRRDYMAGVRP